MKNLSKKILSILVVASILLTSCGESQKETSSKRTQVICTTGVIADAMRNILPEGFEIKIIKDFLPEGFDITNLMGPGVDPHTYKSKTSEMKEMMNADAIVYNGIHFEANLIDAIKNISKTGFVLSLGEMVPKERLKATTDFGTAHDPHFWHDVNLFGTSIQLAGKEFSTKYPASKAYIDSATTAYTSKLFALEEYVKTEMAKIPDSLRVLITAHDAFGYYGRLFGIEVKGVQGISTASDVGVGGIIELTSFIVERKIPAIFVENSVSAKNINAVIEGCQAKGLDLKIGGKLFSDGLGDAQSGADTYIKMIKKNTNTIVNALVTK